MTLLQSVAARLLVDRLGYGLVHFLWEGLLIAAALALVLRVLRGRPAARHTAAWIALATMAAAVPLTAWLVPGPAMERAKSSRATLTIERRSSTEVAGAAVDPGSQRLPSPAESLKVGEASVERSPSALEAPSSVASQARSVGASAGAFAIGPWMPWVVGIWSAGVVLFGLWRLVGWLAVGRLCRRGVRPARAELQALLDRLIERMPTQPTVRLLESTLATVPAVVGSLRPVILLPVGIVTGLSSHELELILIHELAHIRRFDYLANLIQSAVETCLFYHPAVWWVSQCIRVERERCCDDAVVSSTGERMLYARTLTRLEDLRADRRACRSMPVVAADDGFLLNRVRRILGLPDEQRRWATARLIGVGAAMSILSGVAGFVTFTEPALTSAAAETARATDQELNLFEFIDTPGMATLEDAPAAKGAPRVVEVFPPDGARGVEPITEIRVRFDRPMDPSRVFLAWDPREQFGYRVRGPLRYDDRTQTFSLPVHLTPGGLHRITAGKHADGPLRTEGFESVEDVAAEPFSWSFTTADQVAAEGVEPPRVTAVDPSPDTQQALVTPLQITFDRPMDPLSYGVAGPEPDSFGRQPALLDQTEYHPESRTFTLLLKLPPNWNGEVRLVGFRSAEGGNLAGVSLAYRTRREPLAKSIRARVERAGRDDPELVRFIERVQAARRDRPGLREEVLTTSTYGLKAACWHQSYATNGATFAMRGDRHFYGEVDEIVGIPFRVGSDGETCWFRSSAELRALPINEVAEKNLLVGDPFGAMSRASAREVIRERKLEDLGQANTNGRPCRRIRSWDIRLIAPDFLTSPIDWYIDIESLLPLRMDTGFYSMDFSYPHLGEPIPDEFFRRQSGPGIREVGAEPMAEGYTRRFLNVIDGSNGRMSVRWGSKGPAGTTSSGLN